MNNFNQFLKAIGFTKDTVANVTALEALFNEQVALMGEDMFETFALDVLNETTSTRSIAEEAAGWGNSIDIEDLMSDEEDSDSVIGYTTGSISVVADRYGYRLNDEEDRKLLIDCKFAGIKIE